MTLSYGAPVNVTISLFFFSAELAFCARSSVLYSCLRSCVVIACVSSARLRIAFNIVATPAPFVVRE
jgi:hypothetical protein